MIACYIPFPFHIVRDFDVLDKKLIAIELRGVQSTIKAMAEDSRIQIKGGNYIGKMDVKGDYNHQQIDRVEAEAEVVNKKVVESPIVKQTALEVQNLLLQLSGDKPLETKGQQMTVAAKAVEVIEAKPELKKRVVSALKAGGVAAFETAIDHPAVSFFIAATEDWQDTASGESK